MLELLFAAWTMKYVFTVTPEHMILAGTVTAYSDCDYENCHTANNKVVAEGMVANNCLPFGTRVEINGRTYEVQDRMNRRWNCMRFDIFMRDKNEAKKWGKRILPVVVI